MQNLNQLALKGIKELAVELLQGSTGNGGEIEIYDMPEQDYIVVKMMVRLLKEKKTDSSF